MKWWLLLSCSIVGVFSQSYYENGEEVLLTPLTQPRGIVASQHLQNTSVQWYQRSDGTTLGVLPQILISWADTTQKEQILATISSEKTEDISPTITLVTLPQSTDVFALSKELYTLLAVKSAHPNFIKERQLR